MDVIRLGEVASTQDVARDLPVGTAVVADHQTRGRGRLGRCWQAPPGSALLASFVLPFHPLGSLAAGVAAAEACGEAVRLKWPNDLLLGGRKLGGILVEADGRRAIVGIGVNLRWAPPGAASLPVDRDQLLERLAAGLEHWFGRPGAEVVAAWRERADTLGRRVRITLPGETFEGVAEDITGDGSLIVAGRPFAAGDVTHLRPAPAAPAEASPLSP